MKTASKSILVLILFIGLIAVLIPFSPLLIMLSLGFLPTIVATITQPDDMSYLGYNVGVCNLCGVYPFALDALLNRSDFTSAVTLLNNPTVWLIMFVPAGVGWCISFMIPPLAQNLMKKHLESKGGSIHYNQKQLQNQWGESLTLPPQQKTH